MTVKHIPCGPFANYSEESAIDYLLAVVGKATSRPWILLTNLAYAWNSKAQPDEIDLVAVGPPGVQVIEIKHWQRRYLDLPDRRISVEAEINKHIAKVKKVATRLREVCPKLGYLQGKFLLTREETSFSNTDRQRLGVAFYVQREWKSLLDFEKSDLLTDADIEAVAGAFDRRVEHALGGAPQRLGENVVGELLTSKEDRFHRIYSGRRARTQEKVFLHVYDISAITDKAAAKLGEEIAEREFKTLQRLQKLQTLPSLMDSFQDVPNYPDELKYFSVADPSIPTLEERGTDPAWTEDERRRFAAQTLTALAEFHRASSGDRPLVHRNLTPQTVRVRPGIDLPVFTGLQYTRLPEAASIGAAVAPSPEAAAYTAPEIVAGGLSVADQRSDVYALCATLITLFAEGGDATVLRRGMAADPAGRPHLSELAASLHPKSDEAKPNDRLPPTKLWGEDLLIPFQKHSYRIVAKLGGGSFGSTFRVVEEDANADRQYGTYVAKVLHPGSHVGRILRSYRSVRDKIGGEGMALLLEITADSDEPTFHALLSWVEGERLDNLRGVLGLYAEELEVGLEDLLMKWMEISLAALARLHRGGMTHGDVSGKNLIVNRDSITLIDYDLACSFGEKPIGPGTPCYAAPGAEEVALASNDVYALAATLFHAAYDRDPFFHGGQIRKDLGANWIGLDRGAMPHFVDMVDRALTPVASQRPKDASVALAILKQLRLPIDRSSLPLPVVMPLQPPELSENEVPWLKTLLRVYPGRWGNDETRGLDTDFARTTYVESDLESRLRTDVLSRKIRLVLFCGNAGDGKTAMIQHLLKSLGGRGNESRDRIWCDVLPDGQNVSVNLDGSAAWNGRSALELLDEFFKPFASGEPAEGLHLLAINDGKLLEWIEWQEGQHSRSPFTGLLADALFGKGAMPGWLRFVNFNARSLVGGIADGAYEVSREFLDKLLDRMLGGEESAKIWAPCGTCTASDRCQANRSVRLFGNADARTGRAREQLAAALQAVHQQGRFHITTRDLRAALSYILFGLNYCTDLHGRGTATDLDSGPSYPGDYPDRVFDLRTDGRQGELLKALAAFDPAIDSHPKIDRELAKSIEDATGREPTDLLDSARRRAYFEWLPVKFDELGLKLADLGLARRMHGEVFRRFPILPVAEQKRICRDLCKGMARLEELPEIAHTRQSLALKITPRTPTESAFWVEKSYAAFDLTADRSVVPDGMETLHTHLVLRYTRPAGEELLRINIDLFELLMDLADGLQLADAASDDLFANLAIFKQRLTLEEQRSIFAWNPGEENAVYRLLAGDPPAQPIVVERLAMAFGGENYHG